MMEKNPQRKEHSFPCTEEKFPYWGGLDTSSPKQTSLEESRDQLLEKEMWLVKANELEEGRTNS